MVFALLLLLLVFILLNNTSFTHSSSSSSSLSSSNSKKLLKDLTKDDWPSQSPNSLQATFSKTAVASDNGLCSEIGRSVLLKGGNAIDAGIATSFCIGGLNGHSSGIGGGFLATIYDSKIKKCVTIDARETAPLATNENTFYNNPKDAFIGYKSIAKKIKSYKSIATPGEVHGFWTLFKRYGSGKVAWQDLIFPTVKLLKDGYPVTKLMEKNLIIIKDVIEEEPTMKTFFVNRATGLLYKEGEIIKNPELAETLRKLAVSTDPLKKPKFAFSLITIKKEGYLSKQDLEQYRTIVDENPIENSDFAENFVMCGPKPPSGFAVSQFIVNVMSKLYPAGSNPETIIQDDVYYHRFIEAQKYGYAQRTLLADLRFHPDSNKVIQKLTNLTFIGEIAEKIKTTEKSLDPSEYGAEQLEQPGKHGTSHTSVIDGSGNAISMTSSVNYIYGARRRSPHLGIIYNDQMDDFSLPGQSNYYGFEASKSNFIRPMSSMAPLIIYNKDTGEIKASIGAAGGSRIISAVSQFIIQTFNFNQTVKESIDFPRIHNQFTPFTTYAEKGFPEIMIQSLRDRGHNMSEMTFPFATIQAIVRNPDGSLSASNDYRRAVYMNPAGY
uniref:Uncharacterized protein n=1 Tax=Panagrolaimus sp. PS1159 TaxID=55785 RepID=A0AC35FV63_9BILA